jgi:hypothetical protein
MLENKILIRNFLIFALVLAASAISLCYILVEGERSIDEIDKTVQQTHDIIISAEELHAFVEGMLAEQRGFLLTRNEKFLTSYERKKSLISERIAILSEYTKDDAAQKSRLDEVRQYFNDFTTQLETRLKLVTSTNDTSVIEDITIIDGLRDNIIRTNAAILEEAYKNLNTNIFLLEDVKKKYLYSLLIGIALATLIILVFNAFLLRAQQSRSHMRELIRESEDRFTIALEGIRDGFFDMDIRTGKIFYSAQYFGMLGYEAVPKIGTQEDTIELIHPDDVEAVLHHANVYLSGALSEYEQEYRMKHASGRWIWVKSRGKAIFNDKGVPIRMIGIHTDVTHIVKTREKLINEKEKATEKNKAKSEFLAHMSHEIRTPLTAIGGIAEILSRQQETLKPKQQKLVTTLLNSTSSLKDLINDLLDFSKIESGEVTLDEDNIFLIDLFEEVISMMSLRAIEKGIEFKFDYSGLNHSFFYGDDMRLRQILVNLVSNAIKFTDQGHVKVSAINDEKEGLKFLKIVIEDTGIGIEKDHLDLIFKEFKQADSSVSRKFGGTGLGLPISRNLAKLMGGDIFVESSKGEGAKFTLMLPDKTAHEEFSDDMDYEVANKLSDKLRNQINDEMKVLIVEDYEGNIVLLEYLLDDIGLSYDIARNGVEALELWENNHFDLVLMDVQMPEMDGFTATRKIRELEEERELRRTPILGLTAHALVGDENKCIECGMDAYLPKPIVEKDLKAKILDFLDEEKIAA